MLLNLQYFIRLLCFIQLLATDIVDNLLSILPGSRSGLEYDSYALSHRQRWRSLHLSEYHHYVCLFLPMQKCLKAQSAAREKKEYYVNWNN